MVSIELKDRKTLPRHGNRLKYPKSLRFVQINATLAGENAPDFSTSNHQRLRRAGFFDLFGERIRLGWVAGCARRVEACSASRKVSVPPFSTLR